MTPIGRLRRALGNWGMALALAVLPVASSGCALLLLGAGGAGGYFIRKGEEGESRKKRSEVETNRKYAVQTSPEKVLI